MLSNQVKCTLLETRYRKNEENAVESPRALLSLIDRHRDNECSKERAREKKKYRKKGEGKRRREREKKRRSISRRINVQLSGSPLMTLTLFVEGNVWKSGKRVFPSLFPPFIPPPSSFSLSLSIFYLFTRGFHVLDFRDRR